MSIPPLFPVLKPKLIDATWFNVDQPCDDDNEITLLEQEHQAWVFKKIIVDTKELIA